MLEDFSFMQLWTWAVENAEQKHIVYAALAIIAGIAFRVVKPLFDWIALHVGMIARFFAERADKRREYKRANKMPNRNY